MILSILGIDEDTEKRAEGRILRKVYNFKEERDTKTEKV